MEKNMKKNVYLYIYKKNIEDSLVAQTVKNVPAMQIWSWVWSPGREDPLEKEMATYSSILAWI